MEENSNPFTEQILQLTLEILYLLTGEGYKVVKMISENGQDPIMVPSPITLISERNSEKKILEVTKKIIELLTREVPIRCQDVTVYFSMEEWEYLEGHKDLYKDVMIENQPPFTPQDESINRNPPERCCRPLCSTQEELSISHHDQGRNNFNISIKKEIKEEEEDGFMENYLEGHKAVYKDVMMENQPPLTSPDGSSNGNPPERCPSPLFCRDYTQEDHIIPHHDQGKEVIGIKIEVKDENETYARGEQSSMKEAEMMVTITKEESCLDNSTGAYDGWNTLEGHLISSPDYNEEENTIVQRSQAPDHNPRNHKAEFLFPCSDCGKGFNKKYELHVHQRDHAGKKIYSCPDCKKSYIKNCDLVAHQRIHTGEKPFSCSECGKSFTQKSQLTAHQRVHSDHKPFSCYECKRAFIKKQELVRHERTHTGEKPFSCTECGKSFSLKSQLKTHHRVHTGEKPFPCSECGRCFSSKANRDKHLRVHTGEKPFSCPECWKCFAQKATLIFHQRTHPPRGRSKTLVFHSVNHPIEQLCDQN